MWQRLKNTYHGISAILAASIYGFPGSKMTVVGITGTDGKTTTAHLIHHILKSAGKKVSLVSSVYAEIAGQKYDTGFHVTTPDPWMLQKFLFQAAVHGDRYMVLEVTSHGLDQNRVWGIPFEIGLITNVTHEHLDYHKSYANYLKTKIKLLERSKIAVVNVDDGSFQVIKRTKPRRLVTYGIKNAAEVTSKNFPFTSPLPGEYNRYNCLAAVASCKALGIADLMIKTALKTFLGVKGRFEYFPVHKNFDVIIDFAHTPNAIEKVLSTVRSEVKGKLIHVFGSAGLRDFSKRSIMGEMSAKYTDLIVLTEEDYRTENVDEIIQQIALGCADAGAVEYKSDQFDKALKVENGVFFRIPDRKKAIEFAIQKLAHRGDMVVLTGKAHELSLCRGTVEYPWSEHEAVKAALRQR